MSGGPSEGLEDRAAAIVIEALLRGQEPPHEEAIAMVLRSPSALRHHTPEPDRPIEDIDCCVNIDLFDFAMKVEVEGERLVARRFREEM